MRNSSKQAFTAGQAAKAAGIAYHQLNHWAMLGIVVPSIGEGKGYAGVRAYSLSDVVALNVAARMKESGFPLRKLQGLVTAIQQWDAVSTKSCFVGDESGSFAAYDEREALTTLCLNDCKGLKWFVNISDVAEDMKSRLESQPRPSRGKSLRTA